MEALSRFLQLFFNKKYFTFNKNEKIGIEKFSLKPLSYSHMKFTIVVSPFNENFFCKFLALHV